MSVTHMDTLRRARTPNASLTVEAILELDRKVDLLRATVDTLRSRVDNQRREIDRLKGIHGA